MGVSFSFLFRLVSVYDCFLCGDCAYKREGSEWMRDFEQGVKEREVMHIKHLHMTLHVPCKEQSLRFAEKGLPFPFSGRSCRCRSFPCTPARGFNVTVDSIYIYISLNDKTLFRFTSRNEQDQMLDSICGLRSILSFSWIHILSTGGFSRFIKGPKCWGGQCLCRWRATSRLFLIPKVMCRAPLHAIIIEGSSYQWLDIYIVWCSLIMTISTYSWVVVRNSLENIVSIFSSRHPGSSFLVPYTTFGLRKEWHRKRKSMSRSLIKRPRPSPIILPCLRGWALGMEPEAQRLPCLLLNFLHSEILKQD